MCLSSRDLIELIGMRPVDADHCLTVKLPFLTCQIDQNVLKMGWYLLTNTYSMHTTDQSRVRL